MVQRVLLPKTSGSAGRVLGSRPFLANRRIERHVNTSKPTFHFCPLDAEPPSRQLLLPLLGVETRASKTR
jgi:hypothetical protein